MLLLWRHAKVDDSQHSQHHYIESLGSFQCLVPFSFDFFNAELIQNNLGFKLNDLQHRLLQTMNSGQWTCQ